MFPSVVPFSVTVGPVALVTTDGAPAVVTGKTVEPETVCEAHNVETFV
jgi:hypothetical protein